VEKCCIRNLATVSNDNNVISFFFSNEGSRKSGENLSSELAIRVENLTKRYGDLMAVSARYF
jgi:hypothetical protein